MNLLIAFAVVVLVVLMIWRIKWNSRKDEKQVEGYLSTFNGRTDVRDVEDHYDEIFDDVFFYSNDDPFDPNMVTGWEKCRTENKTGYCVEYGLSGGTNFFAY